MPQTLSVAFLAAVFVASPLLAVDNPRLEAKRIIDTATEEVKKNRDACDKANEKPLEEARRALQDLASRLLKDGDTSGATAVLKKIETLKTDVLGKPASTPARPPAPVVEKPAPQKPMLKRLEGKWDRTGVDEVLVIKPDGSIRSFHKSSGTPGSEHQIVSLDEDKCEIKSPSGWRWVLRPAGEDAIAVFEWNPSGVRSANGIALERIK